MGYNLKKKNVQISALHTQYQLVEYGFMIQKKSNILEGSTLFSKSVTLDSTLIEIQPQWMLRQPSEIMAIISKLQINLNQKILVVNRNQLSMFIYPASRCAILLLEAGAKDIAISVEDIDSLLAKQQNDKIEVIQISPSQSKNQKVILGYKEMSEKVEDHSLLIDTRSWEEHHQMISGYDYCSRKGKIPGSLFPWPQKLTPQQIHQLYSSGKFKSVFQDKKITTDDEIILYCGNGWRASQAWVFMKLYGYHNVFLYSNGWIQWSRIQQSHE